MEILEIVPPYRVLGDPGVEGKMWFKKTPVPNTDRVSSGSELPTT